MILSFISMPGGMEWFIIGAIGLLIFGKRVPEVAKSLGRSIVEFKRGLTATENDIKYLDGNPPPDLSKIKKDI